MRGCGGYRTNLCRGSVPKVMSIECGNELASLPHLTLLAVTLQSLRLGDRLRIAIRLDPVCEANLAGTVEAVDPVFRHLPHPNVATANDASSRGGPPRGPPGYRAAQNITGDAAP